jgi:hypothetical protein
MCRGQYRLGAGDRAGAYPDNRTQSPRYVTVQGRLLGSRLPAFTAGLADRRPVDPSKGLQPAEAGTLPQPATSIRRTTQGRDRCHRPTEKEIGP